MVDNLKRNCVYHSLCICIQVTDYRRYDSFATTFSVRRVEKLAFHPIFYSTLNLSFYNMCQLIGHDYHQSCQNAQKRAE